ncbi:glycoside hydrolase family 2 protein [Sphaerobolus stellatus SS14]|nr:glycoside hydrolase family 2 protein [Sphaerobolus stellatus SS14]
MLLPFLAFSSLWPSVLSTGPVSSLPGSSASSQTFSLSSLEWTLRNQNGSIVIPGAVPSQAHVDLLKAGLITEPLLGINDYTQRWIWLDNWTYTADIGPYLKTISDKSPSTLLTLADQPVAWTDNEFRQYTFNVTHIVSSIERQKNKNLTVSLESAYLYGLNVSSRPDAETLINSDTFEVPLARQWIRKVDSDFGWDWGPAFVPSGIHKPAYFVTLPQETGAGKTGTPSIFVEESSIEIYKKGQKPSIEPDPSADWVVNVTLALRATSNVKPTMKISFPELKLTSKDLPLATVPGNAGEPTFVSATFTVPNGVPELWYPHNLGNPKLYNITVEVDPGVSFTKTTGFRTIVLHQEPYTTKEIAERGITPGDKFLFTINGKAFYTSGTNIIPFDPFYARTTTAQVRWVIESAVKTGQNMLRVWGGGVYQPSDEETGTYNFYEICDELGILAWSELIFSDSLYPINGFLLDTIKPEVEQNVRRINRHPSNAQWAGGNEIEGLAESANFSSIHWLNEYVFLFQDFLHDAVLSQTSSIAYTDCSTTSGYLSLDPYILRFKNGTSGDIYGNSERYNYDASQAFTYSSFPVSRYVNEFGFHSMPSFYSWEEVLESPSDFNFNSTVVMSRDHHPPAGDLTFPNPNAPQGQQQMSSAVQFWLPTPGTSDSNQTFAQWCWSTQVFQSMTMVSQVAFYRLGAGRPENNMGALVWQLNDIWQGVSWSSIEYSGRWKVLQYGETQIFAPVIIYPYWTASSELLEVYIVSDRLEAVNGTAKLTWYTWEGKSISTKDFKFTVPPLNNTLLYNTTGLSNFLPTGFDSSQVFLKLESTAQTDLGTVTNEEIFNPVPLKNAALVDPKIQITAKSNMMFTLSAKGGVSAWTWLDHPAGTVGYFLDPATNKPLNGFYLIPGEDRTVGFFQNMELSKNKKPNPKDFVVRSIWNNKHL